MGKNRTAENRARKLRAFTRLDGTIMPHHERRARQRLNISLAIGQTRADQVSVDHMVEAALKLPKLRGTGVDRAAPARVEPDYSGGVHEQGPPPGPAREQWKRDNFAKHYGMQGKAVDLLAERLELQDMPASDPRNAEAHRQQEQYEVELKAKRSAAARKAAATRAARKAAQ